MRTKFTIIGLILFLFVGMVQATNYYVNPVTGVDENSSHGTSIDMPWKTIGYALSNTPTGENVINLSAGSYSISSTYYLQLGTDIVGAGIDQTIITFSGTGKAFGMWSGSDETGNHVFSDFTLDCLGASVHGFEIASRSGVTIERVKMQNALASAIFAYAAKPAGQPPVYYLKNIIVRNCEFTNCGGPQSNYIGGVVEIGNVDGMLFNDNRIENTTNISYGFKFCNDGYFKNCKIFNNYIRLKRIPVNYPWAGTGFAIEMFNLVGNNEIYNNDINGIISQVWGNKGTAARSVRIYNNRIVETPDNLLDFGVECIVPDMEVDHNYIYLTYGKAFVFWDLKNTVGSPTLIHHNVVEGSGTDNKSGLAFIPSWNGAEINGIKLFNNTVYNVWDGVVLQYDDNGVQLQNIEIKNNIFMNIGNNVIWTYGPKMPTATLTLQDNLMYNYVHLETDNNGPPQTTSSGNLIGVNPQLNMVGLKPTPFFEPSSAASPVVNVTSTTGYPYIGAYDYSGSTTIGVTGVSVSPTTETLNVGATTTLVATVLPSNATNKSVTWSSSNTSVAIVSSTGVVTGVANGSATITVTSIDGAKTATSAITVTSSAAITVTARGENGTNEGIAQLIDGNLNTKWLDFSATSWVQFAYATAQVWNKYDITSGNDAPERDPKDWTIQGSNDGVNWTVLNTQTGQTWSSRQQTHIFTFTNSIAFKYYKWIITANGSGTIIQASEFTFGTSASVAATSVTVSPLSASVSVGATTTLTATVLPSNATNKSVTWSSSNTSVASVSTTGIVTGVEAGSAVITVTTIDGGFTSSATVNVNSAGTLTNVAVNKPVNVDSYNSNYVGSNAVDGNHKANKNTSWLSANIAWPHWIEVDLSGTYSISQLKFWTGNTSYGYPVQFEFQYWNGTNWATIIDGTSNTNAIIDETFATVNTSKVRLLGVGGSDNYFRLFEVEVYGIQSVAPKSQDEILMTYSGNEQCKLQLFPNPVSGSEFTITLPGNVVGSFEISIVSITGVEVMRIKSCGAESIDVSIEDLKSGIYLVRLTTEDMVASSKLVINKK